MLKLIVFFSCKRKLIKSDLFFFTKKYIALERLESIYKACTLVSNICVHASQDAKQPIAIIIPHEVHLRHFLESKSLPGVDPQGNLATLCHNPKVQEAVMKECNVLGKKNDFKPMEMLEAVILTADRKSTRLNSSHSGESRMPSSA